jgi:glycosyltransferase involved in cell wall biosynthesis
MKTQEAYKLAAPKAPTLCIVTPYPLSPTETFIRAHAERLPARTVIVHSWRPSIGDHRVLTFPSLVLHKLERTIFRTSIEREQTAAYLKVFREYKTEAVLAEYGGCGVWCVEACRRAGVPLIVHFHGHDASDRSILEMYKDTYPDMFQAANAVIAVSRVMREKLISLGAPSKTLHYVPYGVDCARFGGADPGKAPPVFVAVGTFRDKKAPQLTIAAFSRVQQVFPLARLRMIGTGPLLDDCMKLTQELGISEAVTFLGRQTHAVVEQEMKQARCFVQHSVVADSGNSEGTPVAILEAGATGLPVVSTRHGGIPDVVIEGETGLLVDEHDVEAMADRMLRLAQDCSLAAEMGRNARKHIAENFSMERRLGELWTIIQSCIRNAGGAQHPD